MSPLILGIIAIAVFVLAARRATAPAPPPAGPGSPAPEPAGPPDPGPRPYTRAELKEIIRDLAQELRYNRPELAIAVAEVESSLRADAVNRVDSPASIGLMQLQLATARYYVAWIDREEQLMDPFTNIRAGIGFLKDLERKHYGNHKIAGVIQMYNLGETRFLAGKRSPDYLRKVLSKLPSRYAST